MIEALLEKFMLLSSPSGYEKRMAYALKEELAKYVDNVKIDKVGNTIAHIKGTNPNAPKTMIFAHVDSLGFVVKKVEDNGLIKLERLGGIPEKVLPGTKISILSDADQLVTGVIGMKSHHAATAEDKYKVDEIKTLFADIGATSKEEVKKRNIDVGCFANYKPSFEKLSDTRICGTSIDNRGGCATLVQIAKSISEKPVPSDVYIVGSVWEEFNLRGAALAAREIQPDISISIDVCLSGDTPDLKAVYETELSKGPALIYYTFHGRGTLNGTIGHKGLIDLATKAAEEENIPIQRFASVGILTDSSYVQMEGNCIAAMEIGFPARYTHSPIEICDIEDLKNTCKLVEELLKRIDDDFSLSRF